MTFPELDAAVHSKETSEKNFLKPREVIDRLSRGKIGTSDVKKIEKSIHLKKLPSFQIKVTWLGDKPPKAPAFVCRVLHAEQRQVVQVRVG